MRPRLPHLAFAAALLFPAAGHALPLVPDGFVDERVADLLDFASCMTFLPDGRVLVTEQKIAHSFS